MWKLLINLHSHEKKYFNEEFNGQVYIPVPDTGCLLSCEVTNGLMP